MSNIQTPIEVIAYGTNNRNAAVAAALELIKAEIGQSGSKVLLEVHLDSLSEYADKIEAALNKS
ncbi:hypothetical protein [Aliivibrio fischeri]|uniref:hypothetical protein n=1 Tax=Aliivibrio fischeri TaxID=668 RepID=UPI00080EB9F3|nr:hypothetical protein [Aliivibrio fischeri]MUH95200.1 hypothetical protein [Aliivibrio fischeri]MUI65112.1 hypothetical protein [Aliivibrio fischeri]OCH43689.1 hypothetical protein A6E02_11365 [Aliivibrio fischeri]OED52870.1 hypothetical protein BEI47_18610 [Aliivibrio fischeri]